MNGSEWRKGQGDLGNGKLENGAVLLASFVVATG